MPQIVRKLCWTVLLWCVGVTVLAAAGRLLHWFLVS